MTTLTQSEQETHLSMTADNRGEWHVYSDDPVMQRRLESVGATLVRPSTNGIGKHYTLRANQISFRKGLKRELTDAQRESSKKLAALARKTNSLVAETAN